MMPVPPADRSGPEYQEPNFIIMTDAKQMQGGPEIRSCGDTYPTNGIRAYDTSPLRRPNPQYAFTRLTRTTNRM